MRCVIYDGHIRSYRNLVLYNSEKAFILFCWTRTRKLPVLRPSVISCPWGKAAWGQILEVLEEHREEQQRKKNLGLNSLLEWVQYLDCFSFFLFKSVLVSMVHGFARSTSLGRWIPMQILGSIPDQINQKLGVFLADLCGQVRSPWHSQIYQSLRDINMSQFKSRFLLIIVKCTQSNKKSNPLYQTKCATYTYRVAK